jgi:D-glycero-alpha-D-manno-heptose-7-phosphate kinase
MPRVVKVRAPTRLDLGGGWTDVPPYCDREGGFVCNIAIDRYATATLTDAGGATESAAAMDAPLIRAALRRSGVSDVDVSLHSDFPVGAGLGGSSAASAALLGAIAEWRGETWDPCEIAEEGRRIEVEELGIAGGRQDHYAATHGGALALRFSDKVEVRRIAMSREFANEFARRSILVYTGESRISGGNITEVLNAYERRDAKVLSSLARMRALAEQIAMSLESGDLDGVAALMGEHWEYQRALHPAIPTQRIDEIVELARANNAIGSKAMGASGGGCVLVIAGADSVERVRTAIEPLGQIMQLDVSAVGVQSWE